MWQLLLLRYRLIPTATQEVSTVIIPFHRCRHWGLEMYGACQLVRGKVQPWPQSASRTHLPNFLVVQIFTFLSLVLRWKVFFQNFVHFHCIPRLSIIFIFWDERQSFVTVYGMGRGSAVSDRPQAAFTLPQQYWPPESFSSIELPPSSPAPSSSPAKYSTILLPHNSIYSLGPLVLYQTVTIEE